MPQLYNDNVGEVLRKYSADSSVTVGPSESNVSATGVQQIVAGNNIQIDPAGGQGVVTVSADLDSALSTYTGNLQAGNITSLGNVTANFFLGNGAFLTGIAYSNIVDAYSNANVANYLQVLTSNVTTTANISATYLLGNGAFITGLPAGYSNADVANYLPTYTGLITAGNISVTDDITSNTLSVASGAFQVNGSNVVGADADFGGNVIVGTDITATGNVSSLYFIGNGAFLTGLPEAYSNANVANYLPTYLGNLQSGNLLVVNSAVIQGNLTVLGNTTTINANTLNINDKDITVANGAVTAAEANGAGLIVGQGNLANIIFNNPANAWTLYPGISTPGNVSAGYLLGNGYFVTGIQYSNIQDAYSNTQVAAYLQVLTSNVITTANIAADYVLGNGRFLTGLPEAYSNANVANYLPTYTGNLQAGNATILGNITANVVSFNTAAGQTVMTGQMTWNAAEETVDLGLNTDVTLQVGQEFVYRVKANGAISNGQIVMFAGVQGDQIVARVANTALPGFNSTYVIGMAAQDIADTASGFVTSEGKVRDVNTGSFVVGDILWLAPNTAGQMSNVKPAAGNARVQVAAVLKTSPGNGGIYQVRVTREPALADLENVSDSATANDFLVYNGTIWNSVPLDISLDTTPSLGGNLTGGNYNITTTGNITAGYFIGNGSQLTGITAANVIGAYSNANVANYLQVLTSNVTTTANIQANYVIGNGTQLTGLGRGNVYSLQYRDANGNLAGMTGVVVNTSNTGVIFADFTSYSDVNNGVLPNTPATNYSSIAYGSNVYVSIANDSNTAVNSSDGISWSYGNLPGNISGASTISFAAGNFIVSCSGSNTIFVSNNGTSWSNVSANANVYSIQYSNGIYLGSRAGGNLARSTDLVSWSNVAATYSGTIMARETGSNVFAISTYSTVGSNYLTNVYVSGDAITWLPSAANPIFTQPTANVSIPQDALLAFGLSGWIVLKPRTSYAPWDDTALAFSNDDFSSVQIYPKPSFGSPPILRAGGGQFLCLNGSGNAFNSYDGINWSQFATTYSYGWTGLTYGNTFVATTDFQPRYSVFGGSSPANLIVPVNNMYLPGGTTAGQILTLANVTTGAVSWAAGGSTYSNANVANYLQVLSSNVTTTANIQANYFIGNGSQLTGITTTATESFNPFLLAGM